MATFVTLILMRKLGIEKHVYNLRLCEWRQRRRATQNFWHTLQQRKQSSHWEMARLGDGTVLRWPCWEMAQLGDDPVLRWHG